MPLLHSQQRRKNAHSKSPVLFTLISLATLTQSLSLSDWQPSASNLTPACGSIYHFQIPNCSPTDFASGNVCSQPCIDALIDLNKGIFNACAGNPQNDQFLIGEFLLGKGISDLCSNVAVKTVDDQGVPRTSLSIVGQDGSAMSSSVVVCSDPDPPASTLGRGGSTTMSSSATRQQAQSSSTRTSSSSTRSKLSSDQSTSSKTPSASTSSPTFTPTLQPGVPSLVYSGSQTSSTASATSKGNDCHNGNGLLLAQQCSLAPDLVVARWLLTAMTGSLMSYLSWL
ncbi:MAG: hypothetical protein M1828_005264 [Chrysothrix sp. TS-e1954]|nr:MAG: hypothetical protein M1828_005264 [Chrysothrix sp. TS-e1954]